MGDATLGLLVILGLLVLFILWIFISKRLNHRFPSHTTHTALPRIRRSDAERRRETMSRAQHQGPSHGTGGIM